MRTRRTIRFHAPGANAPIGRALVAGIAAAALSVVALTSRSSEQAEPAGSPPSRKREASPTLRLDIVDDGTGKPTPARFSLFVDGSAYYPDKVGEHALRFVSVHEAKKQVFVVTYGRGTGAIELRLPPRARTVEVHAAKGFEYLPASAKREVSGRSVTIRLALRRWTDRAADGWLAADEHVHYDRLDPAGDKDWLTMLAGDGLAHAHFMVLKGGKVPGVWARQRAYGKRGEASDGERWIRPGEEYRDTAQGHINLLGLDEVIQPISTGGLGRPSVAENYPPLREVFLKNRDLGGLGGVAHGGSLGGRPTAVADVVLGAVDFFEIGNAHLYSLGMWYRLMNCGYRLPPAAGTDLPNYPFRDPWQPFLGSMRMYVHTGGPCDFQAWKQAVRRGEVFVTSGPTISIAVDAAGPGGTVRLPEGGGEVTLEAELASPRELRSFEIVRNGSVIAAPIEKSLDGQVRRWRIRTRLRVGSSCWLAARGVGPPLKAMKASIESNRPWITTDAVAHTAPVRVLVGDRPIRSAKDATELIAILRMQREYYRINGRYEKGGHRLRVLKLFDEAIGALGRRQ